MEQIGMPVSSYLLNPIRSLEEVRSELIRDESRIDVDDDARNAAEAVGSAHGDLARSLIDP
ncbi:hypothetical protein N825_03540 [Skermanella stibiiresistens SB22]|uniref:Uncharacterized protein n=1 Tax=Skermanella stibiiresistens SB22 TaxID=1385369 RepID=W9H1V4_9PROT|nr:hypothetical protein N825_03540 [Skermanella stibiiresistens SB22]